MNMHEAQCMSDLFVMVSFAFCHIPIRTCKLSNHERNANDHDVYACTLTAR